MPTQTDSDLSPIVDYIDAIRGVGRPVPPRKVRTADGWLTVAWSPRQLVLILEDDDGTVRRHELSPGWPWS